MSKAQQRLRGLTVTILGCGTWSLVGLVFAENNNPSIAVTLTAVVALLSGIPMLFAGGQDIWESYR